MRQLASASSCKRLVSLGYIIRDRSSVMLDKDLQVVVATVDTTCVYSSMPIRWGFVRSRLFKEDGGK